MLRKNAAVMGCTDGRKVSSERVKLNTIIGTTVTIEDDSPPKRDEWDFME